MKFVLTVLGRFLAFIPRSFACAIAKGIGFLIATFPSPRRRFLFANIHRCYPQMSRAQLLAFAKETCAYTVEMALFVLASPYIPLDELKKRVVISDFVKSELKKRENSKRAMLLLIPHFCMMESITLMPALTSSKFAQTGVFYRPFDNASMDAWIKETREKHGLKLLSRKDGLLSAANFLKDGKNIALLIDQDSGSSGILTLFMDMLAPSTDLGGALAEKCDCDVAMFYARRTGFWQSEIFGEYIDSQKSSTHTVFVANKWLEDKLKSDLELSKQWLWLHKRWKYLNNQKNKFRVWHKGGYALYENLEFLCKKEIPRKVPFAVRFPSDIFNALFAIPVVRALRASREDAFLIALSPAKFKPIFDSAKISESNIYLDESTHRNREKLNSLNWEFPVVEILLENSSQTLAEAKIIRPHSLYVFGGENPKIKCEFFEGNSSKNSRTELYGTFLKNYGLNAEFDFSDILLNENLDKAILVVSAAQDADEKHLVDGILARVDSLSAYKKICVFGEFLSDGFISKLKVSRPNLNIEFYISGSSSFDEKSLQNACKISFADFR